MSNSMALITKDVLMCEYLPTYGNTYWETPNIDELASKGTVFKRHYTVAPSTAMAFTSMLTGLYPYLLERKKYVPVDDMRDRTTLFDTLEKEGYENHILWSKNYISKVIPYSNCFGSDRTQLHNLDLNQVIGPSMATYKELQRNDELLNKTMDSIYSEIDKIFVSDNAKFLWIHLPHVLLGRIGYGDDIDLLDKVVGHVRSYVSDENVFVSADHGHMNGTHRTFGYGFDVYESAIHIPLITPKIDGKTDVDYPTSNVNLIDIILDRKIVKADYVLSDSAYYAQPNRKLAIVKGDFKYIYNKYYQSEEMFDLAHDPKESVNLLASFHIDKNRKLRYAVRDVYFSPHWDHLQEILKDFREIKSSIWREGTMIEETYQRARKLLAIPYHQLKWSLQYKKDRSKVL